MPEPDSLDHLEDTLRNACIRAMAELPVVKRLLERAQEADDVDAISRLSKMITEREQVLETVKASVDSHKD